jgi:uncharacterized protein (DUF58 family)
MAVSGVFGWMNMHGNILHIELPDEIYAGRDTLVGVSLVNRKFFMPTYLVRIRIISETADFTLVKRRGTDTDFMVMAFQGRGYKRFEEMELQSPFPINFFVRSKRFKLPDRFVVFPAPKPCRESLFFEANKSSSEFLSRYKGSDGDVQKISDYTGTEPLKHIHWRLSAKLGELKVKEMTAGSSKPFILDLDNLSGVNREDALSYAVFLVNRFVQQNRPVGLKKGGVVIKPALSRDHRLKLLTELAIYDKN